MCSKNKVIFVCGQRGAGKETLIQAVMGRYPHLHRIVPHTTREPRPGEKNGREYHFVGHQEFSNLVGDGRFLWHAQIGPRQRSGTLVEQFKISPLASILDVLPEGAIAMREQVRKMHGEAYIILVSASEKDRRQRIQLRDMRLSRADVDRLMKEDPVPPPDKVDDLKIFDVVMGNCGSDARKFSERAISTVEAFLFRRS